MEPHNFWFFHYVVNNYLTSKLFKYFTARKVEEKNQNYYPELFVPVQILCICLSIHRIFM